MRNQATVRVESAGVVELAYCLRLLCKCNCISRNNKALPLCTPLQETATTCRERCGGGGYLAVNRFGSLIGFAHAGMTAEGARPGY